jgi:hypothetical protein
LSRIGIVDSSTASSLAPLCIPMMSINVLVYPLISLSNR